MLKNFIKDIEIQYDNNQNSQINYIKDIVEKNYNLFLSILDSIRIISLIPTEREDVLYLSDFDTDFSNIIDKIFNDENTKKTLNSNEILPAFYIELLVRNLENNQMSLIKPNLDFNDEMFYSLIAYKYYEENGNFTDFINFLKKKDNLDTILNWLRNSTRFQVYNYLLESTTIFLKENNFDFLNPISDITNNMLNQILDSIQENLNKEKIQLPTVSIEEFDILFYQFLDYISAPYNWKALYEKLKNENRINYEDMVNGNDKSMCYSDENNNLSILISTDGTLRSFCSLVHEFIHFVAMNNKEKMPNFSISEFPSIFFENISAIFLKNKGYSNEIVDEIINERKENNILIYIELAPLFNDILIYLNNGSISREKKVKFWKNQFGMIKDFYKNINKICIEEGKPVLDNSYLKELDIDIEGKIDKECDSLIDSFIKNGLLIVNGYQYLLDTFLATEVLKKLATDETIVPRMIEITDELSNIDLQNIIMSFNLQNKFKQSKKLKKGL